MATRDANLVRLELERALALIPKSGVIFTRPEVDRIAEALGGYRRLVEVVDGEGVGA